MYLAWRLLNWLRFPAYVVAAWRWLTTPRVRIICPYCGVDTTPGVNDEGGCICHYGL